MSGKELVNEGHAVARTAAPGWRSALRRLLILALLALLPGGTLIVAVALLRGWMAARRDERAGAERRLGTRAHTVLTFAWALPSRR